MRVQLPLKLQMALSSKGRTSGSQLGNRGSVPLRATYGSVRNLIAVKPKRGSKIGVQLPSDPQDALVLELAYSSALKAEAERIVGSIPTWSTLAGLLFIWYNVITNEE